MQIDILKIQLEAEKNVGDICDMFGLGNIPIHEHQKILLKGYIERLCLESHLQMGIVCMYTCILSEVLSQKCFLTTVYPASIRRLREEAS